MNDNNQEFLNAYNRLDNYLKGITGVSGNLNLISYLERILPERQQSELKTIRGYKNAIVSHGVNPGYKKPIVPYEWVEWLEDELNYCKMHKDEIADRLKRQVYARRDNNNSNSSAKKQDYAFQKKDTLDKIIVCQQCNSSFVFSEGEQKFYAQHGLETPKLCKSCRNQKKMMQEKVPRACSTCYFRGGQGWFWQSDCSWYSSEDVKCRFKDGSFLRQMPDYSTDVDTVVSLYVCNRSNKGIINDCPCRYWTKKI